jgi:hypothetical protein
MRVQSLHLFADEERTGMQVLSDAFQWRKQGLNDPYPQRVEKILQIFMRIVVDLS